MVGVRCQKFPVLFGSGLGFVVMVRAEGLWLRLGLLVRAEGLCLGFTVYG